MMVQRTGEAETITTHYLFALGLYRGLYIPNWIYRYFVDDTFDPIAVVAGVVQTVLYADFFYSEWSCREMTCFQEIADFALFAFHTVYFTKCVNTYLLSNTWLTDIFRFFASTSCSEC